MRTVKIDPRGSYTTELRKVFCALYPDKDSDDTFKVGHVKLDILRSNDFMCSKITGISLKIEDPHYRTIMRQVRIDKFTGTIDLDKVAKKIIELEPLGAEYAAEREERESRDRTRWSNLATLESNLRAEGLYEMSTLNSYGTDRYAIRIGDLTAEQVLKIARYAKSLKDS